MGLIPCHGQEPKNRGAAMPLITVIIVLIVAGVILYLINNYIPMDRKIKTILNAVVVIVIVLWLLQTFGIIGSLSSVKIK
jgi:hypothetical protein